MNLLTLHGPHIASFRLWEMFGSSLELCIIPEESSSLLVQEGNDIVFLDGTHAVTPNKYQLCSLMVAQWNTQQNRCKFLISCIIEITFFQIMAFLLHIF